MPRVLLFIAFVVMLGVKVVLADGDKVVTPADVLFSNVEGVVTFADVLFNNVEGVVRFAGKVTLANG